MGFNRNLAEARKRSEEFGVRVAAAKNWLASDRAAEDIIHFRLRILARIGAAMSRQPILSWAEDWPTSAATRTKVLDIFADD